MRAYAYPDQEEMPKLPQTILINGLCVHIFFTFCWVATLVYWTIHHDDFCNQFWEKVDSDGRLIWNGKELYPLTAGWAKTQLFVVVILAIFAADNFVKLGAVMAHCACHGELDEGWHKVMQRLLVVIHLGFTCFLMVWYIVGAVWTFGDGVIPDSCKDGKAGNNDYFHFLQATIIILLIVWPCGAALLVFGFKREWERAADPDEQVI